MRFAMKAWRELVTALLLAGIGVPVLVSGMEATTVKQLSLEQMVRGAHRIVHGRRVSQETYWNKNRTRIYTATRVCGDRRLEGRIPGNGHGGDGGRHRRRDDPWWFRERPVPGARGSAALPGSRQERSLDPHGTLPGHVPHHGRSPGSQDGLPCVLGTPLDPRFARIVPTNTHSQSGRAGSTAEQDPATRRQLRQVTVGMDP